MNMLTKWQEILQFTATVNVELNRNKKKKAFRIKILASFLTLTMRIPTDLADKYLDLADKYLDFKYRLA